MAKTDWDYYYQNPSKLAKYTRLYTQNILNNYIKKYRNKDTGDFYIAELGGANSCFLDSIYKENQPLNYIVVDNNTIGLNLLKDRICNRNITSINCDLVINAPDICVDMVFSTGLIEHFDEYGTANIIKAHFDCLKPGGIAIISYPTPTFLYSTTRYIAETLNCWEFPDERPLEFVETSRIFEQYGQIQEKQTLYPLILTQQVVVIRKHI